MLILIISVMVVCLLFSMYILTSKKKHSLQNKIALVTGGCNGLGRQICLELASKGCDIAIADICQADDAINELKAYNVRVKAYNVDISNSDEIIKLKGNLTSEFGEVDILVNNAGLISYQTLFEQSYKQIEKLSSVNVNGVIFMTKCFLEDMMKRGRGHIVTISSLQGIYAFPHSISYCSTKFAVTGFMLAIKEHLRRENYQNIHTTCIHPNVIATRDDIINVVNTQRAPLLRPENCAKKIVEAIEKRKFFVTLPTYYCYLIPIFNLLPFCIQHIIRDYALGEGAFFKKTK